MQTVWLLFQLDMRDWWNYERNEFYLSNWRQEFSKITIELDQYKQLMEFIITDNRCNIMAMAQLETIGSRQPPLWWPLMTSRYSIEKKTSLRVKFKETKDLIWQA